MPELVPVKVDVSLAGDLSKPVSLLIEKVFGAIGSVVRPWQTKRDAEAEAEATRVKAKAEADALMTKTQGDIDATDLLERAAMRWAKEQVRHQLNIEAITKKAAERLEPAADARLVPDAWVVDFFERGRAVSDDDAQAMWARVLAGEVNAPGTFSKRTLNVLAEMDSADAKRFRKLCGVVWSFGGELRPMIAKKDAEYYAGIDLTESLVQSLVEVGLLQYSQAGFVGFSSLPAGLPVSYFGRRFRCRTAFARGPVSLVRLTRPGRELFALSDAKPVDGYLERVVAGWSLELQEVIPPPSATI